MPKLIVKLAQQRSQVVHLREGDIVIGRADGCELQLPNVSVSRDHARVVFRDGVATLYDLGSQNMTLVNGKAIQEHRLQRGDELRVGRFTLIYVEDGLQDQFYKGRLVDYLPVYDPETVMPAEGATYALSPQAIKMMERNARAVENARLISQESPQHFWYPEEGGLTFGNQGQVPVKGLWTFGVVADVGWSGRQHLARRQSFWATISVNGEGVKTTRPLKNGDVLRICNSRFLYERPR
ncbi:MAG: FHA domain-containing protein [Alphaproteobacteria bacterium]|nr:FHA domain-containing protein [Alphaproteobacteria bacterium]MCB9796821.1 FHA domain-containing protein [Alphaproteobacteria bacterium]